MQRRAPRLGSLRFENIGCPFLGLVRLGRAFQGAHATSRTASFWTIPASLGLPRFISFYAVPTPGTAGLIDFVSNVLFEWGFSTAWTLGFIPSPFNPACGIFFILETSMAFGIFIVWLAWNWPSSSAASSRTWR